jgi:MoaA/NifB/PqqE/SkfB family radical SAM enzyme
MNDLRQRADLIDVLRDYNANRQCVDKGTICHAPERSMYFGRDGQVSACCYSRMAPLGRYPEQSIESIWTGAEANAMRAALRKNELPAGCNLCADVLSAGNYSGLLASGFDVLARPLPASGPIARFTALLPPKKAKRYPAQLEFELSNTCNLECAMCSGFWSSTIRAKREKLPPLPQFYDGAFVEQLVPFLPHLKRAKFLGGEPFLIDIYYEIWERLIELNPSCDVSITTNATVYTSKVKRILEKLNCRITVSLDSVNRHTYETIRKNAKFERTLNHLEAFCEVNRLKQKGLTIAVCPLISNCREIPEVVSFANDRGILVFFNTVEFPADQSIKSLPHHAHADLLQYYRTSLPAPRNETEIANRAALEGLCRQIEFWMKKGKDHSILERRCAQWLDSGEESGGVADLLCDLAGNNASPVNPLRPIGSVEPLQDLRAYVQAIWKVGGRLQSEGLLSNTCFDCEDLRIFLSYLDAKADRNQARRIYKEMRRFPETILNFSGTLPAHKLIELMETHFALSACSEGSGT